jgi:RNA polymerase sigma-70 factor, ECF subfamily
MGSREEAEILPTMPTRATTFENACRPTGGLVPPEKLGTPSYQDRCLELENLLSRNLSRLRQLAMRLLRNPHDAEDAVQDALLSAFKNIGRFEGRSQMSTWLTAIVINAARMKLRRRPRQPFISLDQLSKDERFTISELIPDPGPTPEKALEQSELHKLVHEFTSNLPRAQRAAMYLRGWGGLSTTEAAEALGVPVGTLKAQLARARSKITQRLRGALGGRSPRLSKRESRATRKPAPVSRHGDEVTHDAIPMAVVDFGKLVFEQQGGDESGIGA